MKIEKFLFTIGGDIRSKFYYKSYAFKSPVFIPVGSKILINLVLESLSKAEIDLSDIFLISDFIEPTERRLLSKIIDKRQCKLIVLEKPTAGVNRTLLLGVESLLNKGLLKESDLVFVSPITSIFPNMKELISTIESDSSMNYVVVGDERFKKGNIDDVIISTINIDKKGVLIEIYNKDSIGKSGYFFTGAFTATVEQILKSGKSIQRNDDLVEFVKSFYQYEGFKLFKTSVLDFGHEVNYPYAKADLLNSRSFNSFSVNKTIPVVEKRSANKEKLRNEFDYYNSLPNELRVLFPSFLEYKEDEEYAYLKMEYYGYETLANLYLFYEISGGYLYRLYERLKQIIELFKSYKSGWDLPTFLRCVEDMYIEKTEERLSKFAESLAPDIRRRLIEKKFISVNGKYYRNFDYIKEDVYSIITGTTKLEDSSIIHGDLCFSNIIVDINNMIVKLLDVRGEFGKKGIFGDIRYDIAKLAHSSIGGYENILFGFYDLHFTESDIKFEIHSINNQQREYHKKLTFDIISNLGYDANLIMLITGILFISMTPLHYEDKSRQLAQYINGVIILNNALEGKYKWPKEYV